MFVFTRNQASMSLTFDQLDDSLRVTMFPLSMIMNHDIYRPYISGFMTTIKLSPSSRSPYYHTGCGLMDLGSLCYSLA